MAGDKHIPFTQWNNKRPDQAYMMGLLGYTIAKMAEVMGVSPKTIEYWTTNKPEFRERLLEGKEVATMLVAEAFYKNCLDRYVEEEECHVNTRTGQVVKVKVKKFVRGDKWAQRQFLAAKHKEVWGNIPGSDIHLTQNNITNIEKLDLSIFSNQELQILEKGGLNLNQLLENAEGG